ncbi:MAG: hypothetical protein DSZ23_01520, partial [Thermodesulfatator sp.]
SLGFRSLKSCAVYGPKKQGEIRIAIAGDSVTFGEGIRNVQNTYPALLEKLLTLSLPESKIRVFNCGVSAYSVRQMAATLRFRMLSLDPDVVIMAIIPHDLDLSRTGSVDKWGYTVTKNTNAVFSDGSYVLYVLRHFRLIYVLRDIYNGYWGKRQEAQKEKKALKDIAKSSYKYIKEFTETAKSHGIMSLIVLLPVQDRSFPVGLRSEMTRDGIRFLDLTYLAKQFPRSDFQASRFDAHPSAAVHMAIAKKLSEFLAAINWNDPAVVRKVKTSKEDAK